MRRRTTLALLAERNCAGENNGAKAVVELVSAISATVALQTRPIRCIDARYPAARLLEKIPSTV
jgi:hypothetical protein